MTSPLHNTDFYKVDHRRQYPEGTEMVFSNWTARKSRLSGVDKVVFFGLQAYLLNHLQSKWQHDFFEMDVEDVVGKYHQRISGAGIAISTEHIQYLHSLGYLPLEIWALPEGTHVPIGVPMFVMWNTDPKCFWLTNYIETSMSANIWGTCTSATLASRYRGVLDLYAKMTGGDPDFVDWQGHDFSYRGMYGDEAAALSGAGHLTSFLGTDTIPAIDLVHDCYTSPVLGLYTDSGLAISEFIGGSVAATEHSVMCMGTKGGELETFRRLITEVYPTGIVSIVSDTWDYWRILTEVMPALKDEIMARDGKVVLRPDSGDPVDIICGDKRLEHGTPANLGTMRLLLETFGGTRTKRGFMQLDPHVGAIYGDSITLERCEQICQRLTSHGIVPSMVLGIGSYTYQMVTRDTFGFALKSTAGIVNGEVREIFKDPVTDDGTKRSAKGFTAVYKDGTEELYLTDEMSLEHVRNCSFQEVFRDGRVFNLTNITQVRDNVVKGRM